MVVGRARDGIDMEVVNAGVEFGGNVTSKVATMDMASSRVNVVALS